MEINSINNNTNFGARIIIQKTGFKNLGADLVDSFKLTSSSTALGASSSTESTILPCDCVKEFPFARRMSKLSRKMNEIIDGIFRRNIKTSEIEGINVKEAASNSAVTASGVGSMSTGLESYDYAIASALDQSINYPNSSYPASAAEFIGNHLTQSSADHMAQRINSVYNQLWDPRNSAGNELASMQSSTWSGIGSVSQGAGFEMLTKGKKAFEKLDKAERKLPS